MPCSALDACKGNILELFCTTVLHLCLEISTRIWATSPPPPYHLLPPIPPWYLGASHEYQHGWTCPTTEPRPTSLATHTHTHTYAQTHRCTTLIASITVHKTLLPALLRHIYVLLYVLADRVCTELPQRSFLTNIIIVAPTLSHLPRFNHT